MIWEKLGFIYTPSGDSIFKSHAARPVVVNLNNGRLRIFFSSRDSNDRMIPSFIEVSDSNPLEVLYINSESLIDIGKPGTFDDSGITLGSYVNIDDEIFFYHTGWKRRRVVSFELSIGLLKWNESTKKFYRVFEGPIISQDRWHPYLAAGPFVLKDNNRFRMYYCSGDSWIFPNEIPEPIYNVHTCESSDGISWKNFTGPILNYNFSGEVISAPWVIKKDKSYHMWYSFRGSSSREEKAYKIGYAHSEDNKTWIRRDKDVGITRSSSGWDSEMICYPSILEVRGVYFMFYSGNQVGKGGLGVAAISSENLKL
jgi:hypothetical protein